MEKKQYAAFASGIKTFDQLRQNYHVTYVPGEFKVEKILVFSNADFEKMAEDVSIPYPFMEKHKSLMSTDPGGCFHCLLVTAQKGSEGFLIAQGERDFYFARAKNYRALDLPGDIPMERIPLEEPKLYQERSCFFWKVQGLRELTDPDQSPEQGTRFQVEQVVVLPDEQYRQFRENGLMQDQNFLLDHQEQMWMDSRDFCWHCVLVKGENSKDGILVESEGHAYAWYASYVPDCDKLWLQGVPVHYEVPPEDIRKVQNAAERNRMEHYLSFVGAELHDLAFSLHVVDYDIGTDRFTTRLYGGPDSYIEEHLTPKQLADSHHFSKKLREKFFNMDFRYQGEDLNHLLTADKPKKKAPRRGDAR